MYTLLVVIDEQAYGSTGKSLIWKLVDGQYFERGK